MTAAALAQLGVATIYEASGRTGLVDADLLQIIPGSRVAGPARTVLCGQNDNLGVHQALEHASAGEILVVSMPQRRWRSSATSSRSKRAFAASPDF